MSLLDLLILLLVAAVCGSLGMAISGYSHGGCAMSIAIGFIGALLGPGLARWLSLPEIFTIEAGDVRFPIEFPTFEAGVAYTDFVLSQSLKR
jgi:uncharacterized membrane protein YeaQ/YmgE (transglycosylase-associated protein family)